MPFVGAQSSQVLSAGGNNQLVPAHAIDSVLRNQTRADSVEPVCGDARDVQCCVALEVLVSVSEMSRHTKST